MVAMAQYQLPDPGFEDWSGATFDNVAQPKYWHYSNVTQMGFKFNFAHPGTAGRNGGSCIYVEDQAMKVMGIDGGTSPGYVALGQPWAYVPGLDKISSSTAGTIGGIAWTQRPDTLTLWVKRTGNNWDKENYNIVFYMWKGTAHGNAYPSDAGCTTYDRDDEESDIRIDLDANTCGTVTAGEEIGEALWYEKKLINDWVQIKVPVFYKSSEVPEKCNLILSAGNYPAGKSTAGFYAGNGLYVDDVELIYASTIQKLYIGNKEWKGFDPNSTEVQTYSLGAGVTTIPDIYAVRGIGKETNCNGLSYNFSGRRLDSNEMTITPGTVDGTPTQITVTAADGSSTHTYLIQFVSRASTNAKLASIEVNGQPLEDFNAYINNYTYSLPYKTTAIPVVTASAQDANAQVIITQPTGVNGQAQIHVVAQDGVAQQNYTVQFCVASLTDVTLQDILVDGVSLEGFSPNKSNYTLRLPVTATTPPTITPVSAYEPGEQTIHILSNTLIGGCQIQVSIPGTGLTKTYKITYKQEASSNRYLQSLLLNGEEINGWNPTKANYSIVLPQGTQTAPTITYVAGDNEQTITLTENGLNALSTVQVVAGNGDSWTYSIDIRVEQSENASLQMIYLDGEALADFNPTTLVYKQVLESLPAPTITVDKGDSLQQVLIVQATGYGRAQINVTAEAGNSQTYVVRFIRADEVEPLVPDAPTDTVALSDEARLKAIYLDGVALSGFDKDVYTYTVEHLTSLPVVSVETMEAVSSVETYLGSLDANTDIVVTSRDGQHTATYRLLLRAERTSDATLEELAVETYGIDFDPAVTHYTVTVPKGEPFPACTSRRGNRYQTVTTTTRTDCRKQVVTCRVVSADSTQTTEYVIEMGEPITQKNELRSLVVDGYGALTLTGGDQSWDIPLEWGATGMHVQYVKNYDEQLVLVAEGGLLQPTVITVVSGKEGEANTTYTLRPVLAESDPACLTRLMANGTDVPHFNPNTFSYVLPITDIPTFTWQTQNAEVEVETLEQDSKHVTIRTGYGSYLHTYQVYFYYTNDVIPTDFTDWVPTVYNSAQKPRGWMIPADAVKSGSGYTTGNEVTREGSDVVKMRSIFSWNTIAGTVPAIMTIGTLHMNLRGFGSSNSSIDGGIPFRNTPDMFTLGFKPTENTRVDNGRFVVSTYSKSGWTENVANLNYTELNNWRDVTLPITYSSLIDSLNITINGMYSDNMDDYAGTAFDQQHTEMYVRNLRIGYSSAIDHILVAGQNVTGATNMSVTLASSETVGKPVLDFVGQVADQMPVVTWGNEVNRVRNVQIRNYAEDNSYTDYTLAITRPVSTLCDTAYVRRSGDDIVAAATSPYARVTFVRTDSSYQVVVTAENGTEKHFDCLLTPCVETNDTVVELPFIQPQDTLSADTMHYALSSVNTLEMITLGGEDYAEFSPTNYDYEIKTQETVLDYRKMEAGQHVYRKQITAGLIDYHYLYCYAENGRMATYVVRLNHKVESTDASLQMILVNGEELAGFDANKSFYQIELPAGSGMPFVLAQTHHEEADVEEQHTTQMVGTTTVVTYTFTVTAEDDVTKRDYTVVVLIAAKPGSMLDMIYINGDSVANFQPGIFNYTHKLAAGEMLRSATVDKGESAQQVETRIEEDTVRFVVTATDLTQSTYTVRIQHTPSPVGHLEMIYVDGEELVGFRPDEDRSYDVVLPLGTTEMPLVTWKLAEEHETVETETVGSLATGCHLQITVTSQDGETSYTYELVLTVARSTEAHLSDLRVKGQTIVGFDSNETEYTLRYPAGSTADDFVRAEDITAVPVDAQATVTIEMVEGGEIRICVMAEDQKTRLYYIINQEVDLDDNALLSDLLVNGETIDGFSPVVFNYIYKVENTGSVALPGGFIEAEPMVSTSEVWITWPDMESRNMQVGDTLQVHCMAEDGETEQIYNIVVIFGPEKTIPPTPDVCRLIPIPGTRTFKAVTIRNNTHCYIYNVRGEMIWNSTSVDKIGIPVANPMHVTVVQDAYGQDVLVTADERANGAVTCELPTGEVLFAVFFTNVKEVKRKIEKGQKILLLP